MGVKIEAVATSIPGSGGALELLIPLVPRIRQKGALELADEAARKCLSKTAYNSSDVELLINIGIFREKNLGEPALAALIQEDIGANPGHPPDTGHGTFSFDLANGACGLINAFQIINRFLRSGIIQLGLIVASDSDPAPGKSKGYQYTPAGGALLLTRDENNSGFRAFHFENFPEYEYMNEARVSWYPDFIKLPMTHGGQNLLSIHEEPGFLVRCTDCGEITLRKFLSKEQLVIEDIDLIICSQYPAALPDLLERHLEVPGDKIVRVNELYEGTLTAAPITGIEAAMKSGRFQRARRILFVTVGAGISVGLAIYEQAI